MSLSKFTSEEELKLEKRYLSFYIDFDNNIVYYGIDNTKYEAEKDVGDMMGENCPWDEIVTEETSGYRYIGFYCFWTDKKKSILAFRTETDKNKILQNINETNSQEKENIKINGSDILLIDMDYDTNGAYRFRIDPEW